MRLRASSDPPVRPLRLLPSTPIAASPLLSSSTHGARRHLHSFPTRRSSDLPTQREHHTGKEPKVTSETVPTYNPELVQTEDVSETSLQARMLQMHHQGKTAKEIAQSLNCGHTEVELTLKFYEEENA